jgi:hypothetical protein
MLYAGSVKNLVFAASIAALLAVTGCSKKPEPTNNAGATLLPSATAQATLAHSAAPDAIAIPSAEVTWLEPPAWTRSKVSTPMRKATYWIPKTGGDKDNGELGVFYFGPHQGGSVDANIDRWVKQFNDVPLSKVKRADRSANGLVQHTVEIESGSFNANSMGQGPAQVKPNYALLGAIVEAPSGAYFFKLTGPAATVAAARPTFYAVLDSVRTR